MIVTGMQPDCRFVEDVAHTAQVRTELRSQPNPLRFPAAQCRCGAVERQYGNPTSCKKASRERNSATMSRAISASRPRTSRLENAARLPRPTSRHFGNGQALEYRPRFGSQPAP